jgi:hypothetical protein
MKRSLKNLVAAFTLIAAAVPCWAQATLITFATTGTIGTGLDELGLFVPAGGVLDGQKFSMSISIDTSRLMVNPPTWPPSQDMNDMITDPARAAIVTGEVTVTGHSYAWTIDHATAHVTMAQRGMRGETAPDIVSAGGFGNNARDGVSVSALSEMHATSKGGGSDLLRTTQFDQNTTFNTFEPLVLSSSLFHAALLPGQAGNNGDGAMLTYFQSAGVLESAVWRSVSPVPEPGEAAMLVLGIGVLGLVARRRRNGQARAAA